jgi:hypothetical protein
MNKVELKIIMKKNYLSREGYEKLEKELKDLKITWAQGNCRMKLPKQGQKAI